VTRTPRFRPTAWVGRDSTVSRPTRSGSPGSSSSTGGETAAGGALVTRQTGPDAYTRFWSYEPDAVEYLETTYAATDA
jgi:hypothetical protein